MAQDHIWPRNTGTQKPSANRAMGESRVLSTFLATQLNGNGKHLLKRHEAGNCYCTATALFFL